MSTPTYKTIDAADVAGKRVLIRADLNVPMAGGQITDSARIDRLLPGLRTLMERGARLVLLSHFGRPKGKIVPEMSLAPIASALGEALGQAVAFCDQGVGAPALAAVEALADGQVLLLENLRFYPGEEANDPDFAKHLSALGDVYVNDAFSAAHRAHASTHGLAHMLPAYAGTLMDEELTALSAALSVPERPLMAIVGGAKVSTKFDLLLNLVGTVDRLVIGGGMANTFLHAQGRAVGASLHEPDLSERALGVLSQAQALGCEVILPSDVVFAPGITQGSDASTGSIDDLPADQMILDFGPDTVARIIACLPSTRTLIWNGPLGAFEFSPFEAATNAVAQGVAAHTMAGNLRSVAGGGDTLAALAGAGVETDFSYLSTAGGAFLEWMEGRDLPGVTALSL